MKDRSFSDLAVNLDRSAVPLNDSVDNGEAKPGALTDFFRRKEGVKDALHVFLLYPGIRYLAPQAGGRSREQREDGVYSTANRE